ncbi:MAG: sugar phosphate isomerase/epimerase family protein [Armatimonadota bacterium]
MKIAGHTMGMPEMDIFEAISFCAEIGLDGIEVRCADNGQMHLEALDGDDIKRIRDHAQQEGVQFACLTPYYRHFVTDLEKQATLDGFRLACGIARELECPLIRGIAGQWPMEGYEREEVWAKTVSGYKEAGLIAMDNGVKIACETHRGYLTWSATEAAEFVGAVDMAEVGILWDHYWVTVRGEETLDQQLSLLSPWILHVHAKQLQRDEDGSPHAAMVAADGELDWCLVINHLKTAGYEGYVSDEYEKFWHPEDYPEPEVGMKEDAEFLRECIAGEPPKPSDDPAPQPL